jgi:SAM-dependent methyltransferase
LTKPPRRSTAFTGTAHDYLRYRPPYPDAFLADLRARAHTTGRGTLLDLACGPGRVALPMAPYFERVLAVDIEPEMIDVGRREAMQRELSNVDWQVAPAEDLELPAGSIELVTIGEAFHRLDQARVLEAALRWLSPRGALATLAGEQVWRGQEPWKRVLVDVVNRLTRGALGEPDALPWEGPNERLRAADLTVTDGEYVVERVWTCDSIVGYLYSTSIASRRALGDDAAAFEDALRRALLAYEPSGRFVTQQRFGFTLGAKAALR